jgi:hypothetical protein
VLGANSDGVTEYEVVMKPPLYWEIPPGKKIVLRFNNSFQPLGLSADNFIRNCGKLVRNRNFVNMRDEWENVELARRQRLWEALMICHIRNTLLIYTFLFVCFFF